MTQSIVGYKNAVYNSNISDQVFEQNLIPLKNLINELEFIGNLQIRRYPSNHAKETLDLDLMDELIENIISLDTTTKNRITHQYEKAKNFISKYSS